MHVDAFLWVSTCCLLTLVFSRKALCTFTFPTVLKKTLFSSFFKINIYRYRLSVCEVSLQEFPVWGPRPLTRLNLPFQMKAALRERQCCLAEQQSLAFRQQECGMSGVGVRKRGKNAKYVHVCPGLALHSAPSDVLRGPASIKGARLRSQNSDQLLYRS